MKMYDLHMNHKKKQNEGKEDKMFEIVWENVSCTGIERYVFIHKNLVMSVWKRDQHTKAYWSLHSENIMIQEGEEDTTEQAKEAATGKFREVKYEMDNRKIFNLSLPLKLVEWIDGRSKRSFQSRNAYLAKLIMEHYEETTGKTYGE